jgi:hypothetical protein
MAPVSPSVGDQVAASYGAEVAADIVDLAGGAQAVLNFTPGGTLSTPTAGTATWVTLGNVTVPTWATQCIVTWSMYGVISSATEPNVTSQLKVGTAAGAAPRVLGHASATGRFSFTHNESITGLATGSKSITIFSTWTSGANVFSVDANSRVSARFMFQP